MKTYRRIRAKTLKSEEIAGLNPRIKRRERLWRTHRFRDCARIKRSNSPERQGRPCGWGSLVDYAGASSLCIRHMAERSSQQRHCQSQMSGFRLHCCVVLFIPSWKRMIPYIACLQRTCLTKFFFSCRFLRQTHSPLVSQGSLKVWKV